MDESFLSTRQVAKFLDVNEKMVYTLISEKGLPATKVTGKWRFPKRLIEQWLENHIVNHPGPDQSASRPGLIVFAGSNDILLERSLALFNRKHRKYLAVFGNVGSMGGVLALGRGLCHVAASHLMQEDEQEYNFEFIYEKFSGKQPAVVNFAKRRQGLVVAPKNPKGLQSIAGLGKPGIRIANRPKGTGTRLLTDTLLDKAKISKKRIKGYDREFRSHIDVALEVAAGRADAAMAISPVASLLGLGFIPVKWERFDLLICRERFFEKGIQLFLGLLHDSVFRDLARTLGGYDLELCGKIVYPRQPEEKPEPVVS